MVRSGLSLKDAVNSTLPDLSFIVNGEVKVWSNEEVFSRQNNEDTDGSGTPDVNSENYQRDHIYAALSDAKCRAAVQLLLIQAVMEIYNMYRPHLSAKNTIVLYDAVHAAAFHAHKINSDLTLRSKLQELGPITQMQDPPLLRLENESYQICLTFLQNIILDRPESYDEEEVESHLVDLCREVLQFYIEIASSGQVSQSSTGGDPHWLIPLGSGKRRELAARAPLIVTTLQAICSLGDSSFVKNIARFFPLLSSLICCEHGSNDVQIALSEMLSSSVGPILLRSC